MGRIVYAYTWTVKSSRIRRAVTRSLPQKTDLRGAQIVLPPATTRGTVAITLRRPSDQVWSVGELARRGIFRTTRRASAELDETERELLGLLASQQYETFMRRAVLSRKNILVSGPTGSGKTTWTKALIREIPQDERLIAIEDARELVLDMHPDRKSTRLNSSHGYISYAVFCLKKKKVTH